MVITVDQVIDCSGLACPMPILKTKKAIDGIQVGQVIKMIATDPGSTSDVAAWARRTGNALLGSEQENGKYVFYLQKTHA